MKLYVDVGKKGPNAKKTGYYINRLKKIQADPEFSEKLLFAVADRKDYNSEMGTFGLDTTKEASVAIDDFTNSLKYKYDGAFDGENFLLVVE